MTDADFGITPQPLNNPKTRQGARGIVVAPDGKIVLFNKEKMNEYKLPGGGIDPGENPIDAFAREVMEEVGVTVKNIKTLGYTIEEKGQTNFTQTSYVFVSELNEVLSTPNFTEKEIAEGARFIWVDPHTALKLVSESLQNLQASPVDKDEGVYATSFVVVRDKHILEYYLKNKK